ncbi:hypothetical protein Lal_00028167 [Lupinus albus]|nr:hypothetical protein Lal_00028167 [Lupinus albus]
MVDNGGTGGGVVEFWSFFEVGRVIGMVEEMIEEKIKRIHEKKKMKKWRVMEGVVDAIDNVVMVNNDMTFNLCFYTLPIPQNSPPGWRLLVAVWSNKWYQIQVHVGHDKLMGSRPKSI